MTCTMSAALFATLATVALSGTARGEVSPGSTENFTGYKTYRITSVDTDGKPENSTIGMLIVFGAGYAPAGGDTEASPEGAPAAWTAGTANWYWKGSGADELVCGSASGTPFPADDFALVLKYNSVTDKGNSDWKIVNDAVKGCTASTSGSGVKIVQQQSLGNLWTDFTWTDTDSNSYWTVFHGSTSGTLLGYLKLESTADPTQTEWAYAQGSPSSCSPTPVFSPGGIGSSHALVFQFDASGAGTIAAACEGTDQEP